MLPRERHIEIVKLVDRQGTAKTTQLAELLKCTEETIRRDLDTLEKERKVARTHGGAMSANDGLGEVQHHKRENRAVAEKRYIGQIASSFIKEGEVVFIDESSTALAMVDFLPNDFTFTLVTTSLLVSKRVTSMQNVELYLLGGVYDEISCSFGGFLAEQAMVMMTVDRFFFSCKGVDLNLGASEDSEERARLKKTLLKSASWTCALVDHTKLGLRAKFSFILPGAIDRLISDELACSAELNKFQQAGIKTQVTTTHNSPT